MRRVEGRCPNGCGRHLRLRDDGAITCAARGCPAPDAAHRVLSDPHVADHLVVLRRDLFAVQHPLSERAGGPDALADCDLHRFLAGGPPPAAPGRYRATRRDGTEDGWLLEAIDR